VQLIHVQLADLTDDDYLVLCKRLAPKVAELPGLLATVWLADPVSRTYGGVYLWGDRAMMDRFAGSELFAAVTAQPRLGNVHVTDFAVLDGPTRLTLGILAPP
jgi:hypothetical protein